MKKVLLLGLGVVFAMSASARIATTAKSSKAISVAPVKIEKNVTVNAEKQESAVAKTFSKSAMKSVVNAAEKQVAKKGFSLLKRNNVNLKAEGESVLSYAVPSYLYYWDTDPDGSGYPYGTMPAFKSTTFFNTSSLDYTKFNWTYNDFEEEGLESTDEHLTLVGMGVDEAPVLTSGADEYQEHIYNGKAQGVCYGFNQDMAGVDNYGFAFFNPFADDVITISSFGETVAGGAEISEGETFDDVASSWWEYAYEEAGVTRGIVRKIGNVMHVNGQTLVTAVELPVIISGNTEDLNLKINFRKLERNEEGKISGIGEVIAYGETTLDPADGDDGIYENVFVEIFTEDPETGLSTIGVALIEDCYIEIAGWQETIDNSYFYVPSVCEAETAFERKAWPLGALYELELTLEGGQTVNVLQESAMFYHYATKDTQKENPGLISAVYMKFYAEMPYIGLYDVTTEETAGWVFDDIIELNDANCNDEDGIWWGFQVVTAAYEDPEEWFFLEEYPEWVSVSLEESQGYYFLIFEAEELPDGLQGRECVVPIDFGGTGACIKAFHITQGNSAVKTVKTSESKTAAMKVVENGNVYIEKDGVRYNLTGARIK